LVTPTWFEHATPDFKTPPQTLKQSNLKE
jgi:hypothetical protein